MEKRLKEGCGVEMGKEREDWHGNAKLKHLSKIQGSFYGMMQRIVVCLHHGLYIKL